MFNADKRKLILSREPNVIYVGKRLPINYMLGITSGFSWSNTEEDPLKWMGQGITTAVEAVEIPRHRLIRDLNKGKIAIGTEEMLPREGKGRTKMFQRSDPL